MDNHLRRKQKVLTLSHKALLTLGNTIVQSLHFENKNRCDSYSKKIAAQKIKEYLSNSNASSRVYQDLFTKLTECDISMEVFLLAMEVIFNESIKSIETKKFLFCSLEENSEYWDILLKHPGGFQKLKFDYVDEHEKQLKKILKKSPNLKELEMDVRNFMFMSLSFTQTLTKIDLYKTIPSQVAEILLSCPNIESLCSFGEVGESLMICLEKNKNFRSKLKYVRQNAPSREIFEVIVLTCPQMNSLRLEEITDDSVFLLEQTFLIELQIYQWDDRVMALLAKIGCNLRNFYLKQWYDYEIDLWNIYQNCPSLRKLELEANRIYISHKFESFDYLKKLKMFCGVMSISKMDYVTLLSNLKSLEIFEVFEAPFDDDDIQSIFGGRDFVNLTTFIVCQSNKLTAQSVHVLLECCPKLEFIGDITCWNISKNEIGSNFKCLKYVNDCVFDHVLDTHERNKIR